MDIINRLRLLFLIALLLALISPCAARAQGVSAPTVIPAGGSFVGQQTVNMQATSGTVFFTIDGSMPSSASNQFSSPILLCTSTQLNAVAYSGGVYSPVTTVYFDIDPNLNSVIPTFAGSVATGSETLTFGFDSNNNTTITVGGTVQPSDVITITAYLTSFTNGTQASTYTVPASGGTTTSIASGLATTITSNLQSSGITASASGATVTIYNGLILRLRSGFGVRTSGGYPAWVSQWFDLSGGGNSATGSSGSMPILQTGCGDTSNISFNGSSQYLSLPPGFSNFSNGLTAFVVATPKTKSTDSRILDLGNAVSGNDILLQMASGTAAGQLGVFTGSSGAFASSGAALNTNQLQLLETMLIPSGSSPGTTFFVNGTAGTTNTSMSAIPAVTRSSNFIGQASSSGQLYSGTMTELLVFNTAIGSARQSAVRNYLLQRYNISAPSPPTISVAGGRLLQPTQVVITNEAGTTIYVSINSGTPAMYTGPLQINYSQTLNAFCTRNGIPSSVATATYTLDSAQFPAPSPSDPAPSLNIILPTASH